MANPNLKVELLRPEEADVYMRIRHETFRGTINRLLYSRAEECEPSQATFDRVVREIKEGMLHKGHIYLKCTDTQTGEVIAASRWRYLKPMDGGTARTMKEVEDGLVIVTPYDETDVALFTELISTFNANKLEHMSTRPYYCLDHLITLPNHHRRGAGGMLLRWGCDRADEAGVEAYVEASPMGAPLYARYGFQALREIEFDMQKYGHDENLSFIFMRRPAKIRQPS